LLSAIFLFYLGVVADIYLGVFTLADEFLISILLDLLFVELNRGRK